MNDHKVKVHRRVHIFISGRVQGVFFRQFIQEKARELELFGWVQNLPDGRVEVIADGISCKKFLRLSDEPIAEFKIRAEKIKVREFCNLHGLWKITKL